MVNQSTASNEDLIEINRASASVLEKVKEKRNKISRGEEIERVTGRLFEKILTGEAGVEETLEFMAKKRNNDEENNVVDLSSSKEGKWEQNPSVVNPFETETRKREVSPETPEEDVPNYLSGYKKEVVGKNLGIEDNSFENSFEKKLTEVLINGEQLSETEQVEEVRDFLKDNTEIPKNEVEIEAKRTFLEIRKFEEKHPDKVRAIKRENLAKKFEEETKRKNSDKKLTELQEKAIKDQSALIADVFYGNEGIKDNDWGQQNKSNKIAKLEVSGVVSLLNKNQNQVEEIKERNKVNLGNLKGLVLPLGEVPQFGVLDRLINSLDDSRVVRSFELAKNRSLGQKIGLIKNKSSIIGIDGGFVTRIGKQSSQSFIQNSLAVLSTPNINFYSGIRNIFNGIAGGGVKLPAFNLGFDGISSSIPATTGLNLPSLGNKILGSVRNGMRNLGTGLGTGVKKGLASAFNGLGGAVKGLTNAIPQIRVAKTAAMTATVLIIAVVFGIMGVSMAETNQISSLVPPVENPSYYNGDYSNLGSSGIASCATNSSLNIDNFYNIDFTKVVTKIPQNSYFYKENKDIDFSCIKGLLPESGTHKRSDIIKTAYALMGIPYWMGGGHRSTISTEIDPDWGKKVNTPRSGWNDGRSYHGLDCSGFVRWVYNYVTGVTVGGLSGDIYSKSKKINKTELQPGDIGFLYGTGTNHIGIFFGRGTNGKYYFIHSSGRSSKAGPQALGGVYISAANFTHFGRIVSAGLIDE